MPLTTVALRERHRRQDERAVLAPREPARACRVSGRTCRRAAASWSGRPRWCCTTCSGRSRSRSSPARPTRAARRASSRARLRPADSDPDVGGSRQVRHHVLGDRRGHDQPRLQPGREPTRSRSRSTSAFRSSSPRSARSSWRGWARSSWPASAATPSCGRPCTRGGSSIPFWGCKSTGTAGTRGLRAAGRGRRGARPRSSTTASTRSWATRKEFYIARGQYSLGPSIVRGRHRDRHRARARAQPRRGRRLQRQARGPPLRPAQRADARAPRRRPGRSRSRATARAGIYEYSHQARSRFSQQVEHYDTGFQMDTAFLNQVGITQGWTLRGYRLLPRREEDTPGSSASAPSSSAATGATASSRATPGSRCAACACNYAAAGLLPHRRCSGRGALGGADLPRPSQLRVIRPRRRSRAGCTSTPRGQCGRGDLLRPGRLPYSGDQRGYYARAHVPADAARSSQSVTYDRVEFDRHADGERVYTVERPQHAHARSRSTAGCRCARSCSTTARPARILTDLLGSWGAAAGHRVAYVGLWLAHRAPAAGTAHGCSARPALYADLPARGCS